MIVLYYFKSSSPCRAVLLTVKALGLDVELKEINLQEGEHLTQSFLKINPQHCVPTIDDDGFYLWESRAIMCYLVNKYGKGGSLYPEEPRARAVVDQRLYFDVSTLYPKIGDYIYPAMFGGLPLDVGKKEAAEEAFGFLDSFLEARKWSCGDTITIADHALAASIATADVTGFSFEKFPNIQKWYKRAQRDMPEYQEANGFGANTFGERFRAITQQ